MNRAGNPYNYVADPTKGRPLFNSDLYFGVPDLDPEVPANQIQVYLQQEDGTPVAVSQPVETGAGGVPMYNGSPAIILIGQDAYSFKALDRNGTQVYYQENAGATLGGGATVGSLENYAAVRALNGSSFTQVSVSGHTAAGDGGGGPFCADPSDTTTADNGVTVLVDAGGIRWKRVYTGGADIKWAGAVSGGDATAAIVSALAAVDHIVINDAYEYSSFTVPDGKKISGSGSLTCSTSGGVSITLAGGAEIKDITIDRNNTPATFISGSYAIRADGTVGAYITKPIKIQNVTFMNCGQTGILFQYVANCTVSECTFNDTGYAAIQLLSCTNADISNNNITTVYPGSGGGVPGSSTAYGIHVTRDATKSLANAPRSSGVRVTGNRVFGVTTWAALDTHGGQDIAFSGNTVSESWIGIEAVFADGGGDIVPSIGVTITGNTLRGPSVSGAGIVVRASSLSTVGNGGDIVVDGNTVHNYGTNDTGVSFYSAVWIERATGVVLSNNTITNSRHSAIRLVDGAHQFTVQGNSITDVATIGGVHYGISADNANTSGTIDNNTITKTTGSLNGVFIASGSDISVGGGNKFTGVTTKWSGTAQNATGGDLVLGSKATANVDGTTGTIRYGKGITSVSRTGAGQYTVTLSSPMANTNYSPAVSANQPISFIGTITSTTVFTLFAQSAVGVNADAGILIIDVKGAPGG